MITAGPSYLKCHDCQTRTPLSAAWRCSCGGLLDMYGSKLPARSELSARPHNFWRYYEALGFSAIPKHSLGEVMTPLLPVSFRGWDITLKLEYVLPTGSYKDRGVAVAINHLTALGVSAVSEDSSGNAGASTAAYAASAKLDAHIYVPEHTSSSKIQQTLMYGAQCHLIPGARPECTREAQKERPGRSYIGHSWSPFFACGVKSVAYEIAEQRNWSVPDWIVTPAGGGSLVMGLIDGFHDLLKAGYIESLPKILVAQPAACSPIFQAWSTGTSVASFKASSTIAEGAALPEPVRGDQVLKAVRAYGASIVAIEEDEILRAWSDMATLGIFSEPTSALSTAAAWKAKTELGLIEPDHMDVVLLLTGHGLKSKPSVVTAALDDRQRVS